MGDDTRILGELIAEQAAHLDAAHHRLLTNIRQFDEQEGWSSTRSCAHWLSWRVGWTMGTAREHVRVARALAALPTIDEALSRGEVSYCQVRAMTRVATPTNESVLLMDAKLTTGAQLETICRKYKQLRRLTDGATPSNEDINRYVRRRELDNGMVKIEAVLFPEEAAHVWACIDQVTAELAAAATDHANAKREVSTNANAKREVSTNANAKREVSTNANATSANVTRANADTAPRERNVSAETSTRVAPRFEQVTFAEHVASIMDEQASCSDGNVSAETSTEATSLLAAARRTPSQENVSAETSTKGPSLPAAPRRTPSQENVSAEASTEATSLPAVPRRTPSQENVSAETSTEATSLPAATSNQQDVSTDTSASVVRDASDRYAGMRDVDADGVCRGACTHLECILRGGAPDWDRINARVDHGLNAVEPMAVAAGLRAATHAHSPPAGRAIPNAASERSVFANGERDRPGNGAARGGSRFNRADGLVALARRYAAGTSTKTPIEVVVTVPAAVLQTGVLPADERIGVLHDGAPIDGETARRLACDGGIVRLVENANGTPLTVGRRTRSIPSSIRRALLRRDKCCRFPGCTNTAFIEGHHIEHWADGGETSLDNMLALCGQHHRYVHEYGYTIELDATTGDVIFRDPRGKPATSVPPRVHRDDMGWAHIVHANRYLDIDPRVPGWDGSAIPYSDVCHVLSRIDAGRLAAEDVCGAANENGARLTSRDGAAC